jgi:uncharacterized protein (TIGR04255 family)
MGGAIVRSAVRLTFDSPTDVVFKRAPLEVVLCQVRFTPVLALLSDAGVAGFQEGIRRHYPVSGKAADRQLTWQPSSGKIETSQQAPVWRFTDEAGQWTVSLAVDFVALEAPQYTHFDDFAERFDRVLDVLDRTVHPSDAVRIGLRKVNALRHPDVARPSDWASLLNPALLGLLSAPGASERIATAWSELHLKDDEDGILAVRHGVLPDAEDVYRIDLDYFTERPSRIEPGSDLSRLLKEYSTSTTEFFRWCLSPRLTDFLEPTSRPQRRTT